MRNLKYSSILNWILPVVVVLTILTGGLFETIFVLTGYLVYRFYIERDKMYSFAGKRNYYKGRLNKAVHWYGKAYATGIAENRVRISYVYSLILIGDIEKAEEIMEEIRQLAKRDDIESSFLICEALLKWHATGSIRAGAVILEQTSRSQRNSTLYANLGRLYLLAGQHSQADALNQEAYEYNKDNALILENILYLQWIREERNEALSTARKLIRSGPHTPDAFHYAGLVFLWANELKLAGKCQKKELRYQHSILSLCKEEEGHRVCSTLREKDHVW